MIRFAIRIAKFLGGFKRAHVFHRPLLVDFGAAKVGFIKFAVSSKARLLSFKFMMACSRHKLKFNILKVLLF